MTEENKDELTEAEKQKPMTKADKKELIKQLQEFISRKQEETSNNFKTVVTERKTELTKQNDELNEVRKDVTSMKKRIKDLEKIEVSTAEAIDRKIRENSKKQEKR